MTKEDKNPTEDEIRVVLKEEGYWFHIKETNRRQYFNKNKVGWEYVDYTNHYLLRVNDIARIHTIFQEKPDYGEEPVIVEIIFKDGQTIKASQKTGEKLVEKFNILKPCITVENDLKGKK